MAKQVKKKTKKRGRRTKYDTHVKPNLKRIPKWRRDGLTERQVANKLGVAMSTFSNYKLQNPELMEALKKGRDHLIEELEDSLYKRAMGYSFEETEEIETYSDEYGKTSTKKKRVKYLSPDTGALIFALKNLKGDKWRNEDRVIVEDESEKNVNLHIATINALQNRKVDGFNDGNEE